jgi:hypothetical protein
MNKTIRICGEVWDLNTDKNIDGGNVNMNPGRENSAVTIGTTNPSKYYRASILIHEILEGILMYDNKRWQQIIEDNRMVYLFAFDHEYLSGLGPKILDALVSSGVFKLDKEGIK